tara:strand:- start:651 stop:779 length:129 start_codon:yes stop_codon:yes gene_type:complete
MFKYYMGWKYVNESTPESMAGAYLLGAALICCILYFAHKSTK